MLSRAFETNRFRFGLRSLFVGVALVAAGLAALVSGAQATYSVFVWGWDWGFVLYAGLVSAGGALVGAGFLHPFRLTILGMQIGFLFVWPLMALFLWPYA